MEPLKPTGRVPLKPPIQRGTLPSARPLLGLAERRTALLADIKRAEQVRAQVAAVERAQAAKDRTDGTRPKGGSRQRRIQSLTRENVELKQEIEELKQFLIEVGSLL